MFNQFFVNFFSRLIFYKLKGEIHTFAQKCIHFCALLLSPPTRVAWIETLDRRSTAGSGDVATHTGGVDRNSENLGKTAGAVESPPTRVAWIETTVTKWKKTGATSPPTRVAWIETCAMCLRATGMRPSPPTRVAWIETSTYIGSKVTKKCCHPHGWRG